MGFFAAIWNLYLGLLAVVGHALLIIAGIALCGYATMQQLEQQHDTTTDVVLFGVGILLVSFSTIRRLIWTFTGVGAIWGAAVWFGAPFFMPHEKLELSPELIAIVALPPLIITLFSEATRKRPVNEPELEISLSTSDKPKP